MEKINILVIGAGVIGLAVARVLSKKHADIVLCEKEKSWGRHTSSRNSEVIHSGIYYPADSLKAKFCVAGNHLLYEYLNKYNIPYKNTGKLVVATGESEEAYLANLQINAVANGVTDTCLIGAEAVKAINPQIIASLALQVPSTGIMDTHKLMHSMAVQIEENDGFIIYEAGVISIKKYINGYIVEFANGEKYLCTTLINCAALHSDTIAQMLGIDTVAANLQVHWCKGEYYKSSEKLNIETLVYPVPDPLGLSLGIHLSINLAGEMRFGPSAYYVDKLDYQMDESRRADFEESIKRYLNLDMSRLHPDDTGIRPKLQAVGETFRDFFISDMTAYDCSRYIHLGGIESPGLTSCLAIASYVEQIVDNY